MSVVLPIDEPNFNDVIGRVRGMGPAADLGVRLLGGGLTNTNYLVGTTGEQYVVRIVGQNGNILVSDRLTEETAMRRAVAAGIAPEVVAFVQPEGHMVTRYLVDARPLTIEEFTSTEMVPRLAQRLKQVHELEAIDGSFDPYADIRRWLDVLAKRATTLPSRLESLLDRVAAVERRRMPLDQGEMVLCHNDPYHLNFLEDGSLWLIDWEYAGMGDPMYDLASIGYVLDVDTKNQLLQSYFGSVTAQSQHDLDSLIYVVLCWNTCWSLIQAQGGVSGFDYIAYAERFLDRVPRL